jgi:hypothetical protein
LIVPSCHFFITESLVAFVPFISVSLILLSKKSLFIILKDSSYPENNKNFSISKDGKTATSTRTVTPVNGVIENFWTIAAGDPLGKHQIEVYIDERLIGTFAFEIVPF